MRIPQIKMPRRKYLILGAVALVACYFIFRRRQVFDPSNSEELSEAFDRLNPGIG
jgi:hypothetical protein